MAVCGSSYYREGWGRRKWLNLVLDSGEEMNKKLPKAVSIAIFNLVKYLCRCYKKCFPIPGSLK